MIKTHFRQKGAVLDHQPIPTYSVPSHDRPRFSYFVEREAAGVSACLIFSFVHDISLCLLSWKCFFMTT